MRTVESSKNIYVHVKYFKKNFEYSIAINNFETICVL